MITRGQYLASLYPYSHNIRVHDMDGLNKLKGIADSELAVYLAVIWDSISSVSVKKRR